MCINYNDIGKRIRFHRKSQNLSQEKLAELTDMSTTHISHIETGNTKLSLPAIINIANSLGITVDLLLCDSVNNSSAIYNNELTDLLSKCTPSEIRVITDIVNCTLNSLRKNYPSE